MDRIDAINWLEQWADRHEVAVRPLPRVRPGEHRAGLPVELLSDVSVAALEELVGMGRQLVFEEMGPPPAASGPACGSVAGGDEPPMNNMGGKVTNQVFRGFEAGSGLFVGVDQFTVVGQGPDKLAAMRATLQGFLGEGQKGLFGLNTYKDSWHFEDGSVLLWTLGRPDWCFMARGQTLQVVGQERHREFILACDEHADHCTRVDPRIDDYSREVIDLAKVREAKDQGNFVGPRRAQTIEDGRICRGKLKLEGASYVFGSRCGARVVFYDKGLESSGRICSNRMEVAYYKEKAADAWVKLVESARCGEVEFTRAVGQLVCGAVDFRERGEDRHVVRMERLSWWSRVVDLLGTIRLRVEKAVSTLNSSMGSMIQQYGKKLARAVVVGEAMGHDLVLQLAELVGSLREGLELQDKDLSPLELAFEPGMCFAAKRRDQRNDFDPWS